MDPKEKRLPIFAAIHDRAVDAIITINEQGIIQSANPATEALFGYSTGEILGCNVNLLMPPPFRQQHDEYLLNYLTTGTKKIIGIGRELTGKRKDGSEFALHLAVSEVYVDDRRLFVGFVRDLSDIKERESNLRAILDNAVDAIISIDQKGIVLAVNPATESMFGFKADEIIGRNVNRLMPSPFFEEHDGYLENYLKSGQKKIIGIGREVVGKRKDGSDFPIHLAVSEIAAGGRRIFTGIIRDISDLKEAEKRLSRLNEELEIRVRDRTKELRAAQSELLKKEKLATLGQVSGGIAHEIRNPLNAVKTSAFYLMHAKNPTSEKTQEHLERIDRQVDMIDSVITALSDVAKLPAPSFRKQPIVPCLQHELKSISMPENIETEILSDKDVPDVLMDERQVPIVFRNLFRNARDAMPDGGKLTIRVSKVGNDPAAKVLIEIIDSGVGIPPDQLSRVMEPLFSTKARGMGLGLAISKAITEKNRGSLACSSELGKGSNFQVTLMTTEDQVR